jgi:hypothetical protein
LSRPEPRRKREQFADRFGHRLEEVQAGSGRRTLVARPEILDITVCASKDDAEWFRSHLSGVFFAGSYSAKISERQVKADGAAFLVWVVTTRAKKWQGLTP